MNVATRALEAVVAVLADAEITASRDASTFDPTPIGVLVGLPTLEGRTLSASKFSIPILVVSGDPVNTPAAVDRLYGLADEIGLAVATLGYRPTTWSGSSRVDPLSAIEIVASVTVSIEEE